MGKSKKKQAQRPPQKPRRFSPNTAKRITGWLMVLGIVICVIAINHQSTPILLLAVAEWLPSLCFLLYYWRCPVCGKSLPKTGKITECPKCGAKIN